ncbi:MAG TPA: gamma-glutamylcyclotransferase family protein [Acidimicrobiales bacterium]
MFHYFGYGSNMDLTSLRAKGVTPSTSQRAALPGWRLRFNVAHFFRHEGGVGNIERTDDPADRVLGVVHLCEDSDLARLDEAEAYPIGYDRVELAVLTDTGPVTAVAYVGTPAFVDDTRLPSRRYLNILVAGATAAGIDSAYIEALRAHQVLVNEDYPPFTPPAGEHPGYTAAALAARPELTALADAVFDMSEARPQHRVLRSQYGGRDMTLYHLRRMDSSAGTETEADIARGRLSEAQRAYLNEYLHEYAREYRYAGRYLR